MPAAVTGKDKKVKLADGELVHGEPVYIVRGSDAQAVAALIGFARRLEEKDRAAEADEVFNAAMDFSEWQRDNPEKVRILTKEGDK